VVFDPVGLGRVVESWPESLYPTFRAIVAKTSKLRKSSAIAFALLLAIWGLAALQWPLHDLVVPWDSNNQFFAFFRFMAATIHEGVAPFWNPYHYAGHPSIADPQSLIFSPAFVLWALVDPKPSLFAFDLMVFAHLLVGGFAIVGHGRRHDWSLAASILAAMVFMFGGAVSGRLNHVGIITAYALFPLALLWMEIALDFRSVFAAIGFGFVTALIMLGRSQEPLLLCFVLGALLIHHIVRQPGALHYLKSRLAILALAAVVTSVIVTVPMLLTLQFADFSNRPKVDLELALMSSLSPVNLANFFVPNVFGSLEPLKLGNWGPGDRAFNYLFAGTLPALLLIWHGVLGGRVFARGGRIFVGLTIFAMLYAFGRYTPIFPFMFEHAPGIDLFRRPVGATFIFVLGLAYLSGYLATDYVRHGNPSCPPAVITAGIIAIASLLAWAIAFSAIKSKGWAAAYEIGKMLPLYIGMIAILVWPTTRPARIAAIGLAVAFTAGELIMRNVASQLNAEPRSYYAMLEGPTGETAHIVDVIKQDMRQHSEKGARPRVEIVGLGGPWQNAAMVLGLEATNGYNPLRIGPYDRLVSPGESPWTSLHRRFPASFPGYDCLLGRMLGLQYVVIDRPIEKMPYLTRQTVADAIVSGPKVWIYRLDGVAPRVTLQTRVRVANSSEYIDEGQFPENIAPSEVLVDSDDDLSQTYSPLIAEKSGKAEIVEWRPDRVEIRVETGVPSILSLHDPWYPGWEAEVDDVPQPILRTDVLFRGVEIRAGAHKVTFTYRPLSIENLWAAARHAALNVLLSEHSKRRPMTAIGLLLSHVPRS